MPQTIHPSPKDIPAGWQREPVRPAEYRGDDFEAQYDSRTLFYDAFWVGTKVALLGPPLLNLQSEVQDMRVIARPSGNACAYRTRSLHLHSQIWVDAPPGTHSLMLETGMGEIEVSVAPPRQSPFENRRVLCTMSKDNDLTWIEDWVRFHRDIHGADAVLIYDNASRVYPAATLVERLRALDGIRAAAVVSWPFKYGPQGYQSLGFWDSTYSQPAAFEHARWSLLGEARSVMNADVDELVHSHDGRRLFEATESSTFGVLRYNGLWVPTLEGMAPRDDAVPRHRDFEYYIRATIDWSRRPPRRGFSAPKWTVVPRRCPSRAQWQVHRIRRWPAAALITPQFTYRHYRRLSTGWKYDRADAQPFDPNWHVHDNDLVREYAQVRWDR